MKDKPTHPLLGFCVLALFAGIAWDFWSRHLAPQHHQPVNAVWVPAGAIHDPDELTDAQLEAFVKEFPEE